MRKSMLVVLTSALLLTGCSLPGTQQNTTPPPQTNPDKGGKDTAKPPVTNPQQDPQTDPQPVEKTEEQIQSEIKTKLARMTQPMGYLLDRNADGTVKGATTLDDVAEQLRKKGYAPDIAKQLAKSFYREESTGIKPIATEGWPGVFDSNKEATFTKKNKWTWVVEQKHPEDQLYGPHTAHYEVEVLKDGTYRLNVWTTEKL